MSDNCIFCKLRDERVIYECEHTKAFIDTYPASPGHTLIIPKRHFATYFEAT
ncbi:MAG TPA: HIT domain-containing protein, partial [Candidatus Thioglobus sp.]|nr:HIT domain-containing protein [Candidatus Thioglobus sp.]